MMGWGVQGTMKKGGGQRGINKDSSQPFRHHNREEADKCAHDM